MPSRSATHIGAIGVDEHVVAVVLRAMLDVHRVEEVVRDDAAIRALPRLDVHLCDREFFAGTSETHRHLRHASV
jgi:hypothetical protein